MEFHNKPDLDYVRRLLGHKSILNTQIYLNMERMVFNATSDEYVVKVAATLDDAYKLLEAGFEYITDIGGQKLFRKRK